MLRWPAAGLLDGEKKVRKVKGYREADLLHHAQNPSLTPQEQVA
jgi:hypothetical protein